MTTDVAADLDVLYLPDEMKLEFCLELLEASGAEKIKVKEDRGEIIHCCLAPWHNENRPSASLNFKKMVYRCLGCPASGGILWLIGTVQNLYGPEARNWLSEQTGLGGKEFQLAPLLRFLDAIEESGRRNKMATSMPRYSEAMLEPWSHIYPGLTTGVPDLGIEGRGIPEQNLVEARVGWDMEANRIIIPHFWKGDLVGWQSRRILEDGSEKYKSTPEFPRDRTIYLQPKGKRIVVVESPMSVLRHKHHLPVGGTFGGQVTDQQVALLRWYPEVVFWMDNDPGGWGAVEGHWDQQGIHHPGPAEALTAYSNVTVVPSDWVGDPAEIDDETAEDLVEQAVPLSLWSRPTVLRCMSCKQPHGGPCA
jgi:hypothetical protein